MKDSNGERVSMDRKELQKIYDDTAPLISFIDQMERSTTISRDEYKKLPAKYNYIRLMLGFTKTNYETESMSHMLRAMIGTK